MPNQSKIHWRVGTRGSRLALTQTKAYIGYLQVKNPSLTFDIEVIATSGDKFAELPPEAVMAASGKGIFTKEIEDALLKGSIDFAVHSLKDLPSGLPDGLILTGFIKREEARDALVAKAPLAGLTDGAKIGTSSLRRKFQILEMAKKINKRFEIVPLRGNVDTRVKKALSGELGGALLSYAGCLRMGFKDSVTQVFDPVHEMVPACGQGVMVAEIKGDRRDARELLGSVEDAATRQECLLERRVLETIGGGCLAPLGIYCRVHGANVSLALYYANGGGEGKIRHLESPISDFDEKVLKNVRSMGDGGV